MQLTGRVFIKIDGDVLRSKPGAKLNYGGFNRAPVIGNEVHGFAEEVVAPTVECVVSHAGDTSLEKLANLKGVTLTFETDTNQVYVIRDAWTTEPPVLTSGQGECELKFAGVECKEL